MRTTFLLMSSFLVGLVPVLSACSASPEPSSLPPPASASTEPGWRDIHPAPARRLGMLQLRQSGTTLEGELHASAEDDPTGETFGLYVRWDGRDEEVLVGTIRDVAGETFRGELTVPSCTATSKAPRGILVVRAGTSVVGVSRTDRALFPTIYFPSFEVELASCRGPATTIALPPIPLSADPRLPLALCTSGETGPIRCGMDVFSEVRIVSASASVSADGSVLLSFVPAYNPPDETPTLLVNGVAVERTAPRGWQARLPSRDAAPLRSFDNEIVWSLGKRPPWRARVTLPPGGSPPRIDALQVGRSFVVETDPMTWARTYSLSIEPVLDPPLKSVFSFSSETPRIEGTFQGFEHTARATPGPTSAEVTVMTRGGRSGFEISQAESTFVPIVP